MLWVEVDSNQSDLARWAPGEPGVALEITEESGLSHYKARLMYALSDSICRGQRENEQDSALMLSNKGTATNSAGKPLR